MGRLDYFLEKRWQDWPQTPYTTKLPATRPDKFTFQVAEQISGDSELYNYIQAYYVKPDANDPLTILELAMLVILDSGFEITDVNQLRDQVAEIILGRQPTTRLEKLIWNIIEALHLIREEKFEINEANYELFIHVLFRDMNYDLYDRENYYRDKAKIAAFDKNLWPSFVDLELKNFFAYIEHLKNRDILGYTQTFLVFLEMLFTSPYKAYNFITAVLLGQWFYNQFGDGVQFFFPVYEMALHWKKFLATYNQMVAQGFEATEMLRLLRQLVQQHMNLLYRRKLFSDWVATQEVAVKELFNDWVYRLTLLGILSFSKEISTSSLARTFKFNNIQFVSEEQVEQILQALVDQHLLAANPKKEHSYLVVAPELVKLQLMLKG